MTLAQAIEQHIDRTLAECGGNISKAARELGIHRSSLQRRLRRRERMPENILEASTLTNGT